MNPGNGYLMAPDQPYQTKSKGKTKAPSEKKQFPAGADQKLSLPVDASTQSSAPSVKERLEGVKSEIAGLTSHFGGAPSGAHTDSAKDRRERLRKEGPRGLQPGKQDQIDRERSQQLDRLVEGAEREKAKREKVAVATGPCAQP